MKVEKIDYTKFSLLKPVENTCMIQSDTDSMYMSADELYQKTPDMDDLKFLFGIDKMFGEFWSNFLTNKAKSEGVEDLIKFSRESLFGSFLSIKKKMYIGTKVVEDDQVYGYDHWKPKISGISLHKSAMPKFCKTKGDPLIFNILTKHNKAETDAEIVNIFNEYKQQKIEDISSNGAIGDYKKYVPARMKTYLDKPILANFMKGWSINAKIAFSYNWILEKFDLPLTPISSGEKFNYIFVKPTNQFGIEAIAYVDEWPEQFSKFFEIDYEMSFRKFFLPIFDQVYNIINWKNEDEIISLKRSSLDFLHG